MEFEFKIQGLEALQAKLNTDRLQAALADGIRLATLYVEGYVKENKLTGRPPGALNVRTGRLRASILSSSMSVDNNFIGKVGTNVVYAAIHEFGGIIRPRNKPYLKFKVNGQWRSTKQVTIPKRPFMQPALDESAETINNIVLSKVNNTLEG